MDPKQLIDPSIFRNQRLQEECREAVQNGHVPKPRVSLDDEFWALSLGRALGVEMPNQTACMLLAIGGPIPDGDTAMAVSGAGKFLDRLSLAMNEKPTETLRWLRTHGIAGLWRATLRESGTTTF
jgi:hypothetical protein